MEPTAEDLVELFLAYPPLVAKAHEDGILKRASRPFTPGQARQRYSRLSIEHRLSQIEKGAGFLDRLIREEPGRPGNGDIFDLLMLLQRERKRLGRELEALG